MSLTSLFLSKTKTVDAELDALFKSAPKPEVSKKASVTIGDPKDVGEKEKKRNKRKAETPSAGPSTAKKLKPSVSDNTLSTKSSPSKADKKAKQDKKAEKDKRKEEQVEAKEKKDAEEKKHKSAVSKKSFSKKFKVAPESSEDEDDDSDLENQYLTMKQKKKPTTTAKESSKPDDMDVDEDAEEEGQDDGPSDTDDDSDGEIPVLVHESTQDGRKSKARLGKQKFIPSEETPEQRDQRTVFIGNLPLSIAQKRPLQKQFQKHILALVPAAKIESVRFRSVPFQNPTSKLPTSDNDEDPQPQKKGTNRPSTAKPNGHGADRANSWRTRIDQHDEQVVKQDEKKYLTPGQKKKIAFIHHEFHSTADSINAYVVFAHPVPSTNRPANLPPLPPTMDPYDAAQMAVEKCNNTTFMERVIRVDRVGKVVGKKRGAVGEDAEGGDATAAPVGALLDADPKFTIFVGNLDFASKEEDLRAFFENLLIAEKGAPPASQDSDEEDEADEMKPDAPKNWVVRVRIVRDKETQLGKGFAYVQFADKECVDEVLALEELKLKFAKRKLRVQRCKTLPGSSVKIRPTSAAAAKPHRSTRAPIVVPKGDPTLGERLAHLPKTVRKAAKAADGERIARRLAKKKARMAMGPPKDMSEGRDRTRKSAALGSKKGAANSGKKTSKPRVRSAKNAEARNAKK